MPSAEYLREWRAANPGKNAEHARRWRERNRAKVEADNRRKRTRNRIVDNTNRRAQIRGNGGSFTRAELDALGKTCAYCGITTERIQPDHIIPISRGGRNDIGNIAPCCPTCNMSKQGMTGEEYLTSPRFARRSGTGRV